MDRLAQLELYPTQKWKDRGTLSHLQSRSITKVTWAGQEDHPPDGRHLGVLVGGTRACPGAAELQVFWRPLGPLWKHPESPGAGLEKVT